MRAAVMMAAVAVVLAGCPKPPTPAPPMPPDAAFCASPATPNATDVCDGFFTAQGYACVRCPNVSSCVDRDLQIWCVAGSCAGDPACSIDSGRHR